MRTGAETNGEGQIENQKPLEFSDDWGDGHFELVGVESGVCAAWVVRNLGLWNSSTGETNVEQLTVGEGVK